MSTPWPLLVLGCYVVEGYSGAPHIPPGQLSFGSWILVLGILGIGCLVAGWLDGWLMGWLLLVVGCCFFGCRLVGWWVGGLVGGLVGGWGQRQGIPKKWVYQVVGGGPSARDMVYPKGGYTKLP